jgi:serine O-acetyltransferase
VSSASDDRDGPSAVDAARAITRASSELVHAVRSDTRGRVVGRKFFPSRADIVALLDLYFPLLWPGYGPGDSVADSALEEHVASHVTRLYAALSTQLERCLCYAQESALEVPACRQHGRDLATELVADLPRVRRGLLLDLQAALDGDPAATNLDEIVLAYPGLYAITVHRIAHELHALGVPLAPRVLSEHAHTWTGADIHPGATIGESFFIDHATGVVVGETAVIGARVKLYQGVTLGALSMPKDERGQIIRGRKRHPTVEDDVTVYANATVLGGDTVLGKGSTIGGGVFLTKSVPPYTRVALDNSRVRIGSPLAPDFEI